MSTHDTKSIEETRQSRLVNINLQMEEIRNNLTHCENVAAGFFGSGAVILILPFLFAVTFGELWTWLAASAGPFTVAGFLYVAATNYQQQMQFLITEKADIESQGHREQQSKIEDEQMREKQCERLLEAYLRLQSTVDLLRPGFEVESGASTRGPAGFTLLKSEIMRTCSLDGIAAADAVPIQSKQNLAAFVKAIDGIMTVVGSLNAERRRRFKTQIEALITQDERDVISICQGANQPADKPALTLNEWLTNHA